MRPLFAKKAFSEPFKIDTIYSIKSILEVTSMKKRKHRAPVCPYCGRTAVLRPASYVYHGKLFDPAQRLYVCAGYPECNSYVGVHSGTLRPKGTLANSELRNLRIRTHKAFDQIWRSGVMSRPEAYHWLQDITGLRTEQTHIAMFSEFRCKQVIRACEQVMQNQGREGA